MYNNGDFLEGWAMFCYRIFLSISIVFMLVISGEIQAGHKTALITGVTGQDGAYLSEFLLDKGYIVHGIKRRSSSINTARIDHIFEGTMGANKRFILHHGDVTDASNMLRIIQEVQPDEIYNLAAQSHVQVSFEMPAFTAQVDGLGTLNILEAIRSLGLTKKNKILPSVNQ